MKFLEKLANIMKKLGGVLCVAGAVVLVFLLVLDGLVSKTVFSKFVPWLFPWVFGFPGGAALMVLGSTLSQRLRRPAADNGLYERILEKAQPVLQLQSPSADGGQILRRVYKTQGGRILEKREVTHPQQRTPEVTYRYLTETELETLKAYQEK